MIRINLNGQVIEAKAGQTILQVSEACGITIPTLCHLQETKPFTSCMICAVKELKTGRLLPACSARVQDGMMIETDSQEVKLHRKHVIEMLLSEHVGDCEAPCRMTCPAGLNVPLMLRQMIDGRWSDAANTALDVIALPGTIGHICPAPCEKACRRGRYDAPVSICRLERFLAETDFMRRAYVETAPVRISGKRVAIVGAGPAGLAAAYYLARKGHSPTVFDEHAEPGGQLKYRASYTPVPFEILNLEVELIRRLGVEFCMNTRVDPHTGLARLKSEFDAVVLAPGRYASGSLADWGVGTDSRGIKVSSGTLITSDPLVFSGGEAIHQGRIAVRAMAHGRIMAVSLDQYFSGCPVTGEKTRFESRLGALTTAETAEMMKGADPRGRVEPSGGSLGFNPTESDVEGRRCLHCDCRKSESCRLRDVAEEYGSSQRVFKVRERLGFERNVSHSEVIYEPGKCIKCGICVHLTNDEKRSGLTFMERGFETVVGPPLGESLETAMGNMSAACVRLCPTGALAWKKEP